MVTDIRITQDKNDILSCLQLRRTVFIEEQNVPEDEEVDGDDPNCEHRTSCATTGHVRPCTMRNGHFVKIKTRSKKWKGASAICAA